MSNCCYAARSIYRSLPLVDFNCIEWFTSINQRDTNEYTTSGDSDCTLLITLASSGRSSKCSSSLCTFSSKSLATFVSMYYCGSVSSNVAADNCSFCPYILWHSCAADCYLLLSYRRASTGYICSWWHCSCSLL